MRLPHCSSVYFSSTVLPLLGKVKKKNRLGASLPRGDHTPTGGKLFSSQLCPFTTERQNNALVGSCQLLQLYHPPKRHNFLPKAFPLPVLWNSTMLFSIFFFTSCLLDEQRYNHRRPTENIFGS